MPVTLTTRVDEKLAKLIDEIAKQEGMDRSTIMRRFLSKAVKDWLIEKNLKDYEEGKITLWQAAENCGLSLWEITSEMKKRGLIIPYTLEDLKEDVRNL